MNNNLDNVKRYFNILKCINGSLHDLIYAKRELVEFKKDEEKFNRVIDDILDNEELRRELLNKKQEYFYLCELLKIEENK